MFKVLNGTPKSQSSLCNSCLYGHRIKSSDLYERMLCKSASFVPVAINFCVVECSQYFNKSTPSLTEMEQIAWEVKTRNRGTVGFTKGKELEVTIRPPDPNKPKSPLPKTR